MSGVEEEVPLNVIHFFLSGTVCCRCEYTIKLHPLPVWSVCVTPYNRCSETTSSKFSLSCHPQAQKNTRHVFYLLKKSNKLLSNLDVLSVAYFPLYDWLSRFPLKKMARADYLCICMHRHKHTHTHHCSFGERKKCVCVLYSYPDAERQGLVLLNAPERQLTVL